MQHSLEVPQTETVKSFFMKAMLDGNSTATGIDLHSPFFKKLGYDYSNASSVVAYSQFLQAIELARQSCYPQLSPEDGYALIGYNGGKQLFQTPVGLALKPLVKVLGLQRGASQFTRNMSNAFSFGKHTLEEARNGYIRYRQQGIPNPPNLFQGILRLATEMTDSKDAKFKINVFSDKDFSIEVFWK